VIVMDELFAMQIDIRGPSHVFERGGLPSASFFDQTRPIERSVFKRSLVREKKGQAALRRMTFSIA